MDDGTRKKIRVGDIVKETQVGTRILEKNIDTYSWPRAFMFVYSITETKYVSSTSYVSVVRTDGTKSEYYNWQLIKVL
jgi:hypothetical protein